MSHFQVVLSLVVGLSLETLAGGGAPERPGLPPAQAVRCADIDVIVVPAGRGAHITVRGARYLARAVPLVATVGRMSIERLTVAADGSVAGILRAAPASGEMLVIQYADGTARLACPIP